MPRCLARLRPPHGVLATTVAMCSCLQALVKFNEALAVNKELRQQIDSLRRERVVRAAVRVCASRRGWLDAAPPPARNAQVFDNIYRKLERELHEKKKQMVCLNCPTRSVRSRLIHGAAGQHHRGQQPSV